MKIKQKNNKAFTLIELLSLLVIVVGLVGWVMNFYKLTQADFKAPYKAEVIRGIGFFAPPVGAVAGWVTIED